MNQSYFQKNLPKPLQFWVRPMLLLSLGLHGLFLAIPIPSEKKPVPTKKEPDKIKITQLPTTPPAPNPSPRPVIRPTPKPTPQLRPSIRQRASDIPPIPPLTKSIPRSQPQPTPKQTPPPPTPTPTPSQATATPSLAPPTPTPSPATATPASSPPSPQPSPNSLQNPFADFPFPDQAQRGSLGLLSEADQAARNTPQALDQVVDFYKTALPPKKFDAKPINEATEFKVYKVSKEGAEPQFLHLISKNGKTVIVLASQEIKDLSVLKSAQTRSTEEIAFDSALAPIKASEDFGAVFTEDLGKLPEPDKFADTNKFRGIVATTTFKPMSPGELFNEVNGKLVEAGFQKIDPVGKYGGGDVYKVTQGNFMTYLYFVANRENKTIMLVSNDAP